VVVPQTSGSPRMTMKSRVLVAVGAAGVAGAGFWAGFSWSQRPPVTVAGLDAPARTPVIATSGSVRQASELSDAFIRIAQVVTPAVVRIESERTVSRSEPVFVPRWLRDQGVNQDSMAWRDLPELAGGTGVILSQDGYILTNNHVVADADRVTVALADRRTFPATVVGTDPTTDLAVIRVVSKNLPVARLGDSDESRVGEWVLAVGNPGFGDSETLDFTVTSGIISAKGRPLNVIEQNLAVDDPAVDYAIEDFIQTDAVINPGNSGGPLVNLGGLVIGINTAIASTTGFNQGYGFAIPANLARRVARDLIASGHVRRPLLGVSIVNVEAEDAEAYSLPAVTGVLVSDFAAGSPAEASGVQRHDVIVGIDSRRVEGVGQLQRMVAQREPGDSIHLSVIRFGDSLQFTVRLAEAKLRLEPRQRSNATPDPVVDLGLTLDDMDRATARQLGFSTPGGVLVADVAPLSPADRKQVRPGLRLLSVGSRKVGNAADARAAVRAVASGRIVSLFLEGPDGRTVIANIRQP
jgi:serine protease Do